MAKDYNSLYHQLGRLLEAPADLSTFEACNQPDTLRWLSRGHALVDAVKVSAGSDAVKFVRAMDYMRSSAWKLGVSEVFHVLHRALSHCELNLPAGSAGSAGSFIPVGNTFDAFAALSKIFATATTDVMIVDPYMDEAALVEFAVAVPEGVPIRLLADTNGHKATLRPAALSWNRQYGTSRQLEVRLAAARSLHDRAIFINRQQAWTLTQSLKDFAKRAPGEIVRVDQIAELKIFAYEAIWTQSSILA